MRRTALLFPLLLLLALVAPSVARADQSDKDFTKVYHQYQTTGSIPPCTFTGAVLNSAKKGIPPDLDAYSPDFADALNAALRKRASGACAAQGSPGSSTPGTGSGAGAPAGGSAGSPAAGPPTPSAAAAATPAAASATPVAAAASTPTQAPAPAPTLLAAPVAAGAVGVPTAQLANARSEQDDGTPAPLVGLGVIALLALLGAVAWLLARQLAWEPAWLVRARHATAEAGWRTSAAWSEFSDWVRIGR